MRAQTVHRAQARRIIEAGALVSRTTLWWVVSALCGISAIGSVAGPAVAAAEPAAPLGGTGVSALESPLVPLGVQPLVEGQGIAEAEATRLTSPEAVAACERSQTSDENLSAPATEARGRRSVS